MFKLNFIGQKNAIGKAPGDLERFFTGDNKASLVLYRYNNSFAEKLENISIKELSSIKYDDQVVWLNFIGQPSKDQVEFLQEYFEINPLTIEDVFAQNHRPKFEDLEKYIFFVLRLPMIVENDVKTQQFSIILKNNVIITFLDFDDNAFEDIKKRIFNAKAKLRSKKEDFLFYLLLDFLVDRYFVALDHMNTKYENALGNIESKQDVEEFKYIQNMKHEILNIRRNINAIKDLVIKLYKEDTDIITKDTLIYLKDLVDHTVHACDSSEMLREMIMSLIELSHSSLSNRMNEVMKVLTIISTVFIPISFLAGLYGMNFQNIPELNNPNGYFILLAVMFVIVVSMLAYFRNKKWL